MGTPKHWTKASGSFRIFKYTTLLRQNWEMTRWTSLLSHLESLININFIF
jgi:hypothetical protein